jgi:hypothetical protein
MPEQEGGEPRSERENPNEQKPDQKPKRPTRGPRPREAPGNLKKREEWFRRRSVNS